jgi:hypothetical protein
MFTVTAFVAAVAVTPAPVKLKLVTPDVSSVPSSDTEILLPPPPAGVAHVPSPLQKVTDDALVPEFRFPTGRFPVTPVVSGKPVALVRVIDVGVPSAVAFPEGSSCGN